MSHEVEAAFLSLCTSPLQWRFEQFAGCGVTLEREDWDSLANTSNHGAAGLVTDPACNAVIALLQVR